MRLKLLPSSFVDPALQPLTTFLIDDTVAIDGGSLGLSLSPPQQRLVRNVILTHSHIDHIASLPVFVSEEFPFLRQPVRVYSTRETIASLREHIFNDKIWPDFHRIRLPDGSAPCLDYVEIHHMVPFELENLRVTPVRVNHTVATVGLAIEDAEASVILTSDTTHTEDIWRLAGSLPNLKAIFVDVAYPNSMETVAADSKHLTPAALKIELEHLDLCVAVFAVHLKPQFHSQVVRELRMLGRADLHFCEMGREYVFH